jgi:hypothetical protein
MSQCQRRLVELWPQKQGVTSLRKINGKRIKGLYSTLYTIKLHFANF